MDLRRSSDREKKPIHNREKLPFVGPSTKISRSSEPTLVTSLASISKENITLVTLATIISRSIH
jgi:hypothetical protein